MTTTPRLAKRTSSVSRAWVPTTMSTTPSRSPWCNLARAPAGVRLVSRTTLRGRLPARVRLSGTDQVGQQLADAEEVLLGQDLGGGHEGALMAPLDGHQQGGHRHHRLARTDVALQQPVHGQRPGQVGS